MAHVPCETYQASPIIAGRCGRCGWPEHAHQLGGDRVRTPHEVGQRLSETFDPGGAIDWDIDTWAHSHAAAIDEARALLDAPLATAIAAATADALNAKPDTLTPGEWCDLLQHQVDELRELEGNADVDQPDRQAHHRLVTIAGMATAYAEVLDRHMAKAPVRAQEPSTPTAAKKKEKRR